MASFPFGPLGMTHYQFVLDSVYALLGEGQVAISSLLIVTEAGEINDDLRELKSYLEQALNHVGDMRDRADDAENG